MVSALFDCHGNWTAAIALMDKAALPKPPLTLTYEMLVSLRKGEYPVGGCACAAGRLLGLLGLCGGWLRGWLRGLWESLRAWI